MELQGAKQSNVVCRTAICKKDANEPVSLMPIPMNKPESLLDLARLRQATRLEGYACIADFHNGIYECDHVSPFTKSGGNVDADVMIVAQDWSSSNSLSADPPNRDSVELGYSRRLPTNRNLDDLLDRHFALTRDACYLTNLFPFVKQGGMSAGIKRKDLIYSAKTFTLPEINIVQPNLTICLGLQTFLALRTASGVKGHLKMNEAIGSPFKVGNAVVHCVAHTGALGMNNRGRAQVERDWATIASTAQTR